MYGEDRSRECPDPPYSSNCITGKFLISVYDQLDCLLALADNGVELPDEILGILGEIVHQVSKQGHLLKHKPHLTNELVSVRISSS